MGVDPQLAKSIPVAGAIPRGQQDDACGRQLRPLADLGSQGQAVGIRHAGVEEDQRVRPACRDGVPERVQGRQTVAHRRRLHLPGAEPFLQDVPVGGVVVDDEHMQVVERDRWPGGDQLRGVRLTSERRREGEGAAPARRAVHGKRAAHQSHQPRSDRQAQARPAISSGGRHILLFKGPKDLLLLVGRDADAGVADLKAQVSGEW